MSRGNKFVDRSEVTKSIINTKGLINRSGENNCFLNSAVQVLWHLDVFRKNFRLLNEHACTGSRSCIFCALKTIFTNIEYSDSDALESTVLRNALAQAFEDKKKFQLGQMDDAAECFENLLVHLHCHIAHGVSDNICRAKHCLTHQKFAMNIVEQTVCECGSTSEPMAYVQLVQYINTHDIVYRRRFYYYKRKYGAGFREKMLSYRAKMASPNDARLSKRQRRKLPRKSGLNDSSPIRSRSRSLARESECWTNPWQKVASLMPRLTLSSDDPVRRSVFRSVDQRKECPTGGKGHRANQRRTLTNLPDVVSLGMNWPDDPSVDFIHSFIQSMETTLVLSDLFHVIQDENVKNFSPPILDLVGIVCFCLQHYSTFFFHSSLKVWFSFDDATVSEIGPDWSKVTQKMQRGHYQPLLLIFQNPNASPLDVSTAFKKTFVIQDFLNIFQASKTAALPTPVGQLRPNNNSSSSNDLSKVSNGKLELSRYDNQMLLAQRSQQQRAYPPHPDTNGAALPYAENTNQNCSNVSAAVAGSSAFPGYVPARPVRYPATEPTVVYSNCNPLTMGQLPFQQMPLPQAAFVPGAPPAAARLPVVYVGNPVAVRPVGVMSGTPAFVGGGQYVVPYGPVVNNPVRQPIQYVPTTVYGHGQVPANVWSQQPAVIGTSAAAAVRPRFVSNVIPPGQSSHAPAVNPSKTNGSQPPAADGAHTSNREFSDMVALMTDAMRDDVSGQLSAQAAASSNKHVPAAMDSSCETGSLSDWSVIHSPPSPSIYSLSSMSSSDSNGVANGNNSSHSNGNHGPTTSGNSTLTPSKGDDISLMTFSSPSAVQRNGVPPPVTNASVLDCCSEEVRNLLAQADHQMGLCNAKRTVDVHAALVCCNQALLKYKQCLERVRWEVNCPSELVSYISRRYDECNAANGSLDAAIQAARADRLAANRKAAVVSATNNVSSSPLSAATASRTHPTGGDLIQLDETAPTVRHQLLKEQLNHLYNQPQHPTVPVQAFVAGRMPSPLPVGLNYNVAMHASPQRTTAGVYELLKNHGSTATPRQ